MNPAVVQATIAAGGTLTPMPCVPMTTAPWSNGSTLVDIKKKPVLTEKSTLMCQWGGTISVAAPGEGIVDIAK
jgi:hypothetical protein